VLAPEGVRSTGVPLVRVRNPDLAFARVIDLFGPPPMVIPMGVHPSAVLGKDVRLGREVCVMAHTVVQEGAVIGDGTILYPGVYVGHECVIGKDCQIYPHVTIRERTRIGDRVILHPGVVVGCDGFGYSTIRGVLHKIPQIGIVEIEDDVEIGANTTIDRARFDRTVIGKGTKIDNLVQIAHNVVIGEHSCLAGQSGVAGSTRIGSHVLVGGQAGISGHLRIGDRVRVGGKSGVFGDVEDDAAVAGPFAVDLAHYRRMEVALRRLPEALREAREGAERLSQLSARLDALEGKPVR
jgi:UDP-3-O-[3-hydroxymyristoyl] glucosamine N-acyltransferase